MNFILGCGLARLAFELAVEGYKVTGNDNSVPMIFSLDFLFNL